MNKLITSQPATFRSVAEEKLTRTENAIVRASSASENNPRLSEMNGQQIPMIITAIMLKAATRLGSRPKDPQEQAILSRELNHDLMKFPGLTEREIMTALENGLDGLYLKRPDDPVIFTPSNFVQWIRAYIEETKKPVMKKLAQHAQQVKPDEWIIPDSEQLKMSHEFFLSIMKRVLDGGSYEDYGNVLYRFLEKVDQLVFDSEDKWKAMDTAKLELLEEARQSRDLVNARSAVESTMEMIQRAENGSREEAIVSMAKRILIREQLDFYRLFSEQELTDLFDAIKEKVEYLCIELATPADEHQQS
ncbi:MAG: hypothetical protein J7619_11935 [Dyadobacter sp.]|uniref:hypothetical protein n=1 Tax=Dyadobacter sp. TaxID=1914288 RepID=UPI001B156B9F|nr:hypothetical protein [Dyadobacter sp.]MBO9613402.1 hypothetical protein [Dyadobacter sp.]